MTAESPYAQWAANYRDQGYHVMPCMAGAKIPGQWSGSDWRPMPGWQKYCDAMPPDFLHQKWEGWPEAGICFAHGDIVGLDLDTDDQDVASVVLSAIDVPEVRRRGQKGWMAYYRATDDLSELPARVRWYRKDDTNTSPVVELLLRGTQSVLPPSIHPGTGEPYRWLTGESLADLSPDQLPELTKDMVRKLDHALQDAGLTRQTPRRVNSADYGGDGKNISVQRNGHDLELPAGRSLNNRALEPAAIDQWWPELDMPKSRQRGPGSWEAVPFWRQSNSGRLVSERNPNLKAIPTGIVDFGADRSYTPIDVVVASRDCSVGAAMEWLSGFVRPEDGVSAADMLQAISTPSERDQAQDQFNGEGTPVVDPISVDVSGRSASRFKERSSKKSKPKPIKPTTQSEFRDAFPQNVPPFPVQDFEDDLTGLLREVTLCIDETANMRSEQGAFAAALAFLGVIMGQAVEVSETGLRTNLYVIGTAESGAGKSSAMGSMSKLMTRFGVDDRIAGSDFTSGSAILKELGVNRPQLFNVDEFGDVIRRVLAPRAASHERDIGRILKDMYSSANGIYRGKAYATQERKDIMEPHLVIYGVSTHESFWESIDGRSFNDGLLARFIMIPIGATETQTPDSERERTVSDMVTEMLNCCQNTGNLGGMTCQPVTFDAGIWDQWMKDRALFQRHAERATRMKLPGAPSIIQRICENGMKIAMISAMGRKPLGPVIRQVDYDLGIDVAHWSAIYMISAIDKYYVENASHRDLNRVMEFIDARGEGGCTKSELYAAFQGIFVNGMAAKSIMEALKNGGKIFEWEDRGTGGRPKCHFVSNRYAKAFFEGKAKPTS